MIFILGPHPAPALVQPSEENGQLHTSRALPLYMCVKPILTTTAHRAGADVKRPSPTPSPGKAVGTWPPWTSGRAQVHSTVRSESTRHTHPGPSTLPSWTPKSHSWGLADPEKDASPRGKEGLCIKTSLAAFLTMPKPRKEEMSSRKGRLGTKPSWAEGTQALR